MPLLGAQVYKLSQQSLPKDWIMKKWEEGFYITALAGSTASASLVVMSKGTPYTQQSYKARTWPELNCSGSGTVEEFRRPRRVCGAGSRADAHVYRRPRSRCRSVA